MAKFKVGDKVVIRNDLEDGRSYDDIYCNDDMVAMGGEEHIIDKVYEKPWKKYTLEGVCWDWSAEMFEKKTKTKKTKADESNEIIEKVMEAMSKKIEDNTTTFKGVEKAIKELSKGINNRTLYDEVIMNQIKNKVNEVSKEEIEEKIYKDIDKYITKTFGILPKKIEIQNNTTRKEMTGLFHKKFEEILKIVEKGVPLMLTGPAGAGKNHTLEQVAEALDLDFYFTNAITQEYKLTGFIDAGGVFQETQFYKAFKDGGLFFLDEIDASCPESLIILNSAIANGYFDFPNGRVNVNEKFRVVCAGNTFGTGADMIYVGRNALDGATLDRFATIEFDYDEKIEKQLAYDEELYDFIVALRKAIKETSLRYIVSMRATINASKLLEIGMAKKDILKSVIIKNMQIDDLNTIVKKIKNSSEWFKCLEEIKDVRS